MKHRVSKALKNSVLDDITPYLLAPGWASHQVILIAIALDNESFITTGDDKIGCNSCDDYLAFN